MRRWHASHLLHRILQSLGRFFQPGQVDGTHCGANGVSVYVTHGVFSGGAVARVGASPIENMTVTDSILATEAVRISSNIRQITIAPLMAEAVRRISDESSVSSLFN